MPNNNAKPGRMAGSAMRNTWVDPELRRAAADVATGRLWQVCCAVAGLGLPIVTLGSGLAGLTWLWRQDSDVLRELTYVALLMGTMLWFMIGIATLPRWLPQSTRPGEARLSLGSDATK